MRVRFLSVAAFMTAAVVLAPSLAPAQSLAEVAEKEKERRKAAAQKPAKTYTEDDARNAKGGSTSVTGDVVGTEKKTEGPAEGAAAAAKPEKTESEKRDDARKAWREKLDKANADVTRLSAEVNDLQTQLNDMTVNIYGPGRQRALDRFEQAKKELADARQSVETLTEEGRRAGFR